MDATPPTNSAIAAAFDQEGDFAAADSSVAEPTTDEEVTGDLTHDASDLIVFKDNDDDFKEVSLLGLRDPTRTRGLAAGLAGSGKLTAHLQKFSHDFRARINTMSNSSESVTARSGVASPPFCRICRDPEPLGRERDWDLVSPCRCRGSVAQVHISCLEQWLAESDSTCCELCGSQYRTVRTPRYHVLTSIPTWAITAGGSELLFDILALAVLTPVALLGTYLGMNADERAYAQMSLMAAIDMVYSTWLVMRFHYHFTRWYSWWRRKFTVKLVLDKTPSKLSLNNSLY